MSALFAVLVAMMAAAALACLLWPLLRRGEAARAPTALAAVLSFALPVAALALYFAVGTPAALDPANRVAHAVDMADVGKAVAALEARLAAQPDDVQGWVLLARAYQAMQRSGDAARAFDRALALAPEDADLIAATAEARSLANAGHRIDDDTLALLHKAIGIDPHNQRALWLLGIGDFQRNDFAAAARNWNRLLPLLDPGSDVARSVQEQIRRAEAGLAAASSVAGPATTGQAASAQASDVSIDVHVTMDAALQSRARPTDTVFVYARAIDGPPMPLAVARLRVADLPADLHLDDGMAMTPQLKLSMFPRVQVQARVSASGNATPQSGDLESATATVDTTAPAAGVELRIDHARG